MTRKGAPLHGAIGDGMTAISAASAQLPDGVCACAPPAGKRRASRAPAISNDFVTVAAPGEFDGDIIGSGPLAPRLQDTRSAEISQRV
jgi:hypothetical protein